MSGINSAESDRSASGGRIPEKRVFKPRSIPDIRVQQFRGEPDPGTPEPAGVPAGVPKVQISMRGESEHVLEPPAFRRPGARPQRTPTPVWRDKPVSRPQEYLRQSLKSDVEESLKRFHGWAVLLALLGTAVFASLLGAVFSLGEHHGRSVAVRELKDAKAAAVPSERKREEVRSRLDRALALARSGDAEGGWKSIRGISGEYPHFPSLAYAEAYLALRADKIAEASELVKISISRGERVADSLALQAALNDSSPLSSAAAQEELLRKAADADPMNPYPLLQLALVLSVHGDDERAESLLQSAKLRLLPVDSHAVVDSSLAMVQVRRAPAGSLPPGGEPTGIAEKDFPTAYASMRRGDFQTAATILDATRKSLPPELFDYLLNASPIRDYALKPEITRFY